MEVKVNYLGASEGIKHTIVTERRKETITIPP